MRPVVCGLALRKADGAETVQRRFERQNEPVRPVWAVFLAVWAGLLGHYAWFRQFQQNEVRKDGSKLGTATADCTQYRRLYSVLQAVLSAAGYTQYCRLFSMLQAVLSAAGCNQCCTINSVLQAVLSNAGCTQCCRL